MVKKVKKKRIVADPWMTAEEKYRREARASVARISAKFPAKKPTEYSTPL